MVKALDGAPDVTESANANVRSGGGVPLSFILCFSITFKNPTPITAIYSPQNIFPNPFGHYAGFLPACKHKIYIFFIFLLNVNSGAKKAIFLPRLTFNRNPGSFSC
jgi:hypothetical protein